MLLGLTVGVNAQTTIKDEAEKLVTEYIEQYQNYHFGKVVSIGNKDTFLNAIDKVEFVHVPDLGDAGVYVPESRSDGLNITWLSAKIKLKEDILGGNTSPIVGNTIWHEVIHAIEDDNGDFDKEESSIRDYYERNTEYMEAVVRALDNLRLVELGADKGETNEQLSIRYKEFLELFNNASQQPGPKAYPVELAALKGWMGFYVLPERIMEHYASGQAGDKLKSFAEHFTGVKAVSPVPNNVPTGEGYWALVEVQDNPNDAGWIEQNKSSSYNYYKSYSRGSYSVKTEYTGKSDNYYNPPYVHGESLTVKATWGTPPQTILANQTIKLNVTIAATENTQSAFKFSGGTGAWIDNTRIGTKDNKTWFEVTYGNKYATQTAEVLANLGTGIREGQRKTILLNFYSANKMETGYVYEWKVVKTKTSIELQLDNKIMKVNGLSKEIDQGRNTVPVVHNGRTLIPIRSVFEAMGGSVDYVASEEKIVLKTKDKTLEMWVNKTNIKVNNTIKTIDVAPIVINGRTMVPIRFVAENFGFDVQWNAVERKIVIQ
jgi:hypothetical protein